MAIFVNTGLDDAIQLVLGKETSVAYSLRLFTSNTTVTTATVLADLTECSLSGYSTISLSPSSWTGSTVGGVSTYSYPQQSFTFSSYGGGTTIYGWFIRNTITSHLAWAETVATPFAVPSGGGTFNVTLTDLLNNS